MSQIAPTSAVWSGIFFSGIKSECKCQVVWSTSTGISGGFLMICGTGSHLLHTTRPTISKKQSLTKTKTSFPPILIEVYQQRPPESIFLNAGTAIWVSAPKFIWASKLGSSNPWVILMFFFCHIFANKLFPEQKNWWTHKSPKKIGPVVVLRCVRNVHPCCKALTELQSQLAPKASTSEKNRPCQKICPRKERPNNAMEVLMGTNGHPTVN